MESHDLSAAAVTAGLKTSLIGRRVSYYPSLTSTMDVARQAVRKGAAEGTVIITGEQTKGRGRLRRAWLSPRGSLALSVILYPALASLPYLVMLASLAVTRSIESVTGLKAGIKWPNDVLINGRKVCGILVESEVRGGGVTYAVIGIGINVNLDMAAFPDIAAAATSLSAELGRDVPRVALAQSLLAEVEHLYLALPHGEAIYTAWRDSLVTLGKRVRVTSGDSVTPGVAESVDSDGSLWLRRPDGSLMKVIAGDVSLREAAEPD